VFRVSIFVDGPDNWLADHMTTTPPTTVQTDEGLRHGWLFGGASRPREAWTKEILPRIDVKGVAQQPRARGRLLRQGMFRGI
jgi:hypothetical protein